MNKPLRIILLMLLCLIIALMFNHLSWLIMIYNVHKTGNKEYDIKQVPAFAFIPEVINNPNKGYIWGEFYNKIYEYRNCAWHFEGKLHKHFPKARFTNNEGKVIEIVYLEASFGYKVMYFIRYILTLLLWIGIIYALVYLLIFK